MVRFPIFNTRKIRHFVYSECKSYSSYLPYVFFLVFLKLFVVIFIAYGEAPSDSYAEFSDYNLVVESNGKSKLQPKGGDRTTEDPFFREKKYVLSTLNESLLVPTATNRTPHESIWLFLNRIPRSGGQTLVSLIRALGKDLDYDHQEHEYRTPWQRLMTEEERTNLATWFEYNFWPKSYDRFSLHIDFTKHRSKYTNTIPAYITLVRDPVEKFISDFRYKRIDNTRAKVEMNLRNKEKPGEGRKWYWRTLDECVLQKDPECEIKDGDTTFLSSIPFLCGQHEQCLKHNSQWALQKAKFNAEYEYSVVGVLENLNDTLSVLEHYVPLFFKGAWQRFYSNRFTKQRMENKNPKAYKPISDEVREILKKRFALEYDLYHFLVQRLEKQKNAIRDLMAKTTPLPKEMERPRGLSIWDRIQIELRQFKDS